MRCGAAVAAAHCARATRQQPLQSRTRRQVRSADAIRPPRPAAVLPATVQHCLLCVGAHLAPALATCQGAPPGCTSAPSHSTLVRQFSRSSRPSRPLPGSLTASACRSPKSTLAAGLERALQAAKFFVRKQLGPAIEIAWASQAFPGSFLRLFGGLQASPDSTGLCLPSHAMQSKPVPQTVGWARLQDALCCSASQVSAAAGQRSRARGPGTATVLPVQRPSAASAWRPDRAVLRPCRSPAHRTHQP